MIRTPIDRLAPGQTLARPVPNPEAPGDDLLKAGTILTAGEIGSLERMGVAACWIRTGATASLEERLPEAFERIQRDAYVRMRRIFEAADAGRDADLDVPGLEAVVHQLAKVVRGHPRAFAHFAELPDDLAAHSVAVAVLSLLVGVRLESYVVQERTHSLGGEHARETANLGLGALLHDIGWTGLPAELRYRRHDLLERREVAEIRRHPEIGFDLVRREVEPSAANIVLNHHQRWDGAGYPRRGSDDGGAGLAGTQIPVFSRIVAAANQYRRLVEQPPPDAPGRPPVQALYEMRFVAYREWFDPQVEAMLFSFLPPFPPGHRVVLSGGQEAAVVDFNPQAPCQPTVQVLTDRKGDPLPEGKTFRADLSQTHEAHIRSHDGVEIPQYLF